MSGTDTYPSQELSLDIANSGLVKDTQLSKLTSKLCLLVFLLCVAGILSLSIGSKSIALETIWLSLTGQIQNSDSLIIMESRLPRTLVGLLCGAALALSGSIIQAMTRNPLADPGIFGVNAGASFSVVIGIAFFGSQQITDHLGFAFVGAMLTTVFVYIIGVYREVKVNPIKLTLAGVAISSILASISSGITLMSPETFDQMRFWDIGSLDVRDIELPMMAFWPILVGILSALFIAPSLDNIAMGEDIAQGLGTNVRAVQLTALLSITLLCGSATAIAGPIAFVGLMIPHIARWLAGPRYRWIALYSIFLGPLLILTADIIGRIITTNELRVSIVTAFVGAPVLIYLARKIN